MGSHKMLLFDGVGGGGMKSNLGVCSLVYISIK